MEDQETTDRKHTAESLQGVQPWGHKTLMPGAMIAAVEAKAQADWSDRANEPHKAATIAGIQIGYDRAIAALSEASN